MKKLVYSALALTLTSVPALATDHAWSGLDKEIESLSNSLQSSNTSGPKIGGWIITSYRHSSDLDGDSTLAGQQDQSGFQFDSVRLEVTGDANADYSYKISFDLSSGNGDSHSASPNGNVQLKDAYASFKIWENIKGRLGRFKEPVLRSALVPENRLLFLDRTGLGDTLGRRDLGLMINGAFDVANWYVAAQDGTDGQGDEHTITLRVTADVVGKAGTGMVEGAYAASDETNLSVGLAFQDNSQLDKGRVVAAEASMTMGPFSAAAELVDFDKGDAGTFGLAHGIIGNDVADTTPWDVTVSYAVTPEYELMGRYQDADDNDDTSSFSLGVNRYIKGHDIKWQLSWTSVNTDNAIGDFDQLAAGLAVSL